MSRKPIIAVIAVVPIFFLLIGCGGGTSSGLSTNSANSLATSTGAGATTTGTGVATVSWTAPTTRLDGSTALPLSQIGGYIIYYGKSPTNMTGSTVASGASTTSHQVTGLVAGTYYYFEVSAYDGTGYEGPASAPVGMEIK